MKTDHHETPSGLQHLQAGIKRLLQFIELTVDEHTKGLKSSRRRVLSGLSGFDHLRDKRGHAQGGVGQLPCLTFGRDGFGDAIGKTLFSQVTYHLCDLFGFCVCQPLVNALAFAAVHPHVQRPVLAKRKAALRVVDLW